VKDEDDEVELVTYEEDEDEVEGDDPSFEVEHDASVGHDSSNSMLTLAEQLLCSPGSAYDHDLGGIRLALPSDRCNFSIVVNHLEQSHFM
jgi:hypothetical protein